MLHSTYTMNSPLFPRLRTIIQSDIKSDFEIIGFETCVYLVSIFIGYCCITACSFLFFHHYIYFGVYVLLTLLLGLYMFQSIKTKRFSLFGSAIFLISLSISTSFVFMFHPASIMLIMASVFSFGFIAMYSSPNHWIWIILYSCVISLVCCVMVTLFSSIELRVDSIYVMYSIMMGCVLVGVLAILGPCLRSLMINYAYAYNNAPDNSVIQ